MKLTDRQLLTIQQALGYAVMYAKTEQETAEFALLKLDIDSIFITRKTESERREKHNEMGCPFYYCDSNPPCKDKCHYSK